MRSTSWVGSRVKAHIRWSGARPRVLRGERIIVIIVALTLLCLLHVVVAVITVLLVILILSSSFLLRDLLLNCVWQFTRYLLIASAVTCQLSPQRRFVISFLCCTNQAYHLIVLPSHTLWSLGHRTRPPGLSSLTAFILSVVGVQTMSCGSED